MNNLQTSDVSSTGLIASLSHSAGLDPAEFTNTLKKTVMPGNITNEQFIAFLMVAKKYDLNPITKEIYAFPAKGGIQPIVSIDGWLKIINSDKQFDGMEFVDGMVDGQLVSVTCRIFRKDRTHATELTEYMSECNRGTQPWKDYPARMLRHKATIQCARYAFGLSGIYDPDEGERIAESVDTSSGEIINGEVIVEYCSDEKFESVLPNCIAKISSGAKTSEQMIAFMEGKMPLTDDQKKTLTNIKVLNQEGGE